MELLGTMGDRLPQSPDKGMMLPSADGIVKQEDVDQPLDFSKKDTRIDNDEDALRKLSNDSGVSVASNNGVDGLLSRSRTPSSGASDEQAKLSLSEPRMSLPHVNPLMLPNGMGPGMGMYYPNPGFTNAFMSPGFSPMWPNPMAAAAMMQQQHEAAQKMMQSVTGNGKSSSRPFKQYPKDPLNFSLNTLSGLLPGSGGLLPNSLIANPTAIAEAVKSHEQMFNLYKQQVLHQRTTDECKRKSGRLSQGSNSSQSAMDHLQSQSVSQLPQSVSQPSQSVSQPLQSVSQSLQSNNNHSVTQAPSQPQQTEDTTSSIAPEDLVKVESAQSPIETNGDHNEDSNSVISTSSSMADSDQTPKRKNGVAGSSPQLPTADFAQSNGNSISVSSPAHVSSTTAYSNISQNINGSNRKRPKSLPDDQKDEMYWERRRKNNEAAKRSRDSRRAKEDEIAIRAAFLEQENLRLRVELAALRQQTSKLRSELVMIQSPPSHRPADGAPAEGS